MTERSGVLVMAYGTPKGLGDVERYYTDIRGGRAPEPPLLEQLTQRYVAIGGRSPLLEITEAQARGLAERLGVGTYLGQKHAAPFIADAVAALARDRVERAIGLVLAPHFSTMSVGDYERRARRAAEHAGWEGKLEMIESWHLEPGYVDLLARRIDEARARLPASAQEEATVVFSAHSLPERILSGGDPYPEQLRETAAAVAERARVERWRVAWQSAGRSADPWLGPDILEVIEDLARGGARAVVACPCGFVADHLEVLYDVDIEAAELARARGMALARTASPNDDPAFLDTLATVVGRRLPRA
jgi:ferrochelatase